MRVEFAKKGKGLFQQYGCESCHIPKDSSGRMDLLTLDNRLQYADIIERLTNPTPPMPTFPLSNEDKKALATFLINQAQTK